MSPKCKIKKGNVSQKNGGAFPFGRMMIVRRAKHDLAMFMRTFSENQERKAATENQGNSGQHRKLWTFWKLII